MKDSWEIYQFKKFWSWITLYIFGCKTYETHLSWPILELIVLFTGVVTSPNFPNDYPRNLEENYTIEVEQGQVLLLAFTAFNIDSANDITWSALNNYEGDNQYLEDVTCPSDHLTITDSDGIILMEERCGHILPDRITSRTSKVNLTFHTDDTDVEPSFLSNRYLSTRAGWSLIWSAVTPGMKVLLETSVYMIVFLMISICFFRLQQCLPQPPLYNYKPRQRMQIWI